MTSAQTAMCPISKLNVFYFALDLFNAVGRSLLMYAEQHPYLFGLCLLTIVAGLVTIIVPIAMGFSATGPVAGSMAAAWQASIGNVAAGSLFAILQALTMQGTLVTVGGVLVGCGTARLAGGAAWEWAKSADWTKREDWAMWAHAAGFDAVLKEQWAKSMVWVAHEGWKWTGEASSGYWEGAANGAEWLGREAWRVTDEGVRLVDWEGMAQGAQWMGREGLKWTVEGVKTVNWDGAAKNAEWVGREAWRMTDEGIRIVDWEGVEKGAEWVGREFLKWAAEGVQKVDWEGMAKGAESVGREGRKIAEEVVSNVDWQEAGESVRRVLTSWW